LIQRNDNASANRDEDENPERRMSTETAAAFTIRRTAYIDRNGKALGPLPSFAGDFATLATLYRAMVRTRAFDARAVSLQRTGRLGTFASSLGQEAVGVGAAAAMRAEDVLVPSFRDQAAQLWRGVTPAELLFYWGGDERGSDFAGPREDFPICVPVASHAPHAAGVALALKLRHEARAVVCILGDGATSKGDFQEALTMAGVWRLPLVMLIANNQWAISVPRAAQCAAETLAQKSIAAGIAGEQVDGNDAIAVRDRVAAALERARAGDGATVIEALTYRLSDHTTSDDARRYRDDTEVSEHWHDDPVARLRAYMTGLAAWSRADEEHVIADAAAEMEAAAATWLGSSRQPAAAMFDFLFQTLPSPLAAQRAQVVAEENGDV
jgi:2-oxoisovalerate dehydrogenase E1 component alpha subunit